MTVCDGRDGVLGSGCGIRNTVTIDAHRHGQSFCGVQGAFYKKLPLPLGERKTCLQVAFLLAQPTKVLLRYFRESNKAEAKKLRFAP